MSERGFITLAFDPSYQGESGGDPRDLEDPAARVEDIRCAVDFLTTLPYVGEGRIGILGVCAGGGYAVNAALTEHRIKAVGTVVAVNLGRAWRQAVTDAGGIAKMLEEVGQQRTSEARGGEPRREKWIPDSLEEAKAVGITDPDTLEAVDYYRTPRSFNKNSTNRRLFIGDALVLGFDACHLVGELLTQPIQVIVGGKLGTTFSFEDGKQLWERARNKKDFFVIEGGRPLRYVRCGPVRGPSRRAAGQFLQRIPGPRGREGLGMVGLWQVISLEEAEEAQKGRRPEVQVTYCDIPDTDILHTNILNQQAPLGMHGLGEIANAAFVATGKRVRELPITLDKLLQYT